MSSRLVKHVRWCPPDYHVLERSAPARLVSEEWVVFDLTDPPLHLLWLPWSVLLRYRYGFGGPWHEPDLPWHADVVAVSEETDSTLVVKDMLVDVMVSEDGSRYYGVSSISGGRRWHTGCAEAHLRSAAKAAPRLFRTLAAPSATPE